MVIDWVRMVLEQHKAIVSIVLLLLGISGVSIYGNINEINPWKVAEEAVVLEVVEAVVPAVQTTIIEKTIETRVEAGIDEQDVKALIETRWEAHIQEYH